MHKLKIYFSIICDKEILIKSFKFNCEQINHFKSLLTYMVPFIVSAYTALSIKLKFRIGTTPINAQLKCISCGTKISLNKDDIVPLYDI